MKVLFWGVEGEGEVGFVGGELFEGLFVCGLELCGHETGSKGVYMNIIAVLTILLIKFIFLTNKKFIILKFIYLFELI